MLTIFNLWCNVFEARLDTLGARRRVVSLLTNVAADIDTKQCLNMPEIELWRIFTALGVPGVALGVLYLLFRGFDWRFPVIPRSWVGPIFVLFLLIIWTVVLFALYLWAPSNTGPGKSTSELISVLEARAQNIINTIDDQIKKIDGAAIEASSRFSNELLEANTDYLMLGESPNKRPFSDSEKTEVEISDYILKESWNIIQEMRKLREEFSSLHVKHIKAIADDNQLLAREYSNKIINLLSERYGELTSGNIGIGPGAYYSGYKHTFVDIRHLAGGGDISLTYIPIIERKKHTLAE